MLADPVWSAELTTYVCALRGGLSGWEGGAYYEDVEAYNIEAAANIFYAKHERWPTDMGIKGGNRDYARELEQRIADLQAQLAQQLVANAEGLLPCPFCGVVPNVLGFDNLATDDAGDIACVCCNTSSCHVWGPAVPLDDMQDNGETLRAAIAAWNRRTQPATPAMTIPAEVAETICYYLDGALTEYEELQAERMLPGRAKRIAKIKAVRQWIEAQKEATPHDNQR